MDRKARKRARNWAVMTIGEKEVERFYSVPFEDTGFGYDVFGGERESELIAYTLGHVLYKNYFRIQSDGIENVTRGKVILASNRMGIVPFEFLMCFIDMITNHSPPRLIRMPTGLPVADSPFLGLFYQRMSQMVDTPQNLELVLNRDEALLIMAEEKETPTQLLFKNKMSPFNIDFIEVCLSLKAPIVPVAFFSSEDKLPFVRNVLPLISKLKLEALPVNLNLPILSCLRALPLPVTLHITYGHPIAFYEEYPPETVEHPNLIRQMADVVQERVQDLINEGMLVRQS